MTINHMKWLIKSLTYSCLIVLLFLGQGPSVAQETGIAKVIFIVT